MVSQATFTAFAASVGAERLRELRKSARNEARIRAAGGREHAHDQMRWMRALHAAWLGASVAEVWLRRRRPDPRVAALALAVFGAGHLLRMAAMRELGPRWTVRVMTIPGRERVRSGVYRYLDHPNYLGVSLEIAALPLVHGAYVSSAVFSAANAILLRARIRAEEAALDRDAGARVGRAA